MAADTGPIGGDLSHEFIILAETGESKIYSDKRIFDIDINEYNSEENSIKELRKKYDNFYAVTDEKFKKETFEKMVKKENQLTTKGIEVGHIFYFGDKYSKPLKCSVDLQDGKKIDVKMGSYGVGVSRLVGAIIESKYKNNIMKWPSSITPFEVVIIPSLQKNDKTNYLKAEKIYNYLMKNNIEVLFDDTDEHLSAKFKKFDLIGIPYQIILGSKPSDDMFEFKEIDKKSENLSLEEIKNKLLKNRNLN
jgi:prolyl-tRNA synthetase